MFTPRNTLVYVRLIKNAEEKIGEIIVKTDTDLFCEAEVLAVGPGFKAAEGGVSETHDLKPGQRVLVQHHQAIKGQDGLTRGRREQGQKLEDRFTKGERDLYLFEQTNIMAILSEPVDDEFTTPIKDTTETVLN